MSASSKLRVISAYRSLPFSTSIVASSEVSLRTSENNSENVAEVPVTGTEKSNP
jgi:hypothetical protein